MRKRAKTATEAEALHRHESLPQEEELTREETIRRLRLLGQPVTLFGEARGFLVFHRLRAFQQTHTPHNLCYL